jgi:hypothetical protein
MPSDLFELQLTPFDLGILAEFGIQVDEIQLQDTPLPRTDDEPTDDEIADAIMREMGIQHLPREEVLRTVREFFNSKARKQPN